MTMTPIRPSTVPEILETRLQRVRDDIALIDVALADAHGWGEDLQASRDARLVELAHVLTALGRQDEATAVRAELAGVA